MDLFLRYKHVTKYKIMEKWMIEFLRKFENHGFKIDRFNYILIAKSINFELCCGPLWSKVIFRALSIYREVNATT